MKVFIISNLYHYCNIKNAIIICRKYSRHFIYFVKNNQVHNEKSFAEIEITYDNNVNFYFYYLYGICYDGDFSNKSWKKFIKNKIRAEKLKIFQ